jgi:hypothetical protein
MISSFQGLIVLLITLLIIYDLYIKYYFGVRDQNMTDEIKLDDEHSSLLVKNGIARKDPTENL